MRKINSNGIEEYSWTSPKGTFAAASRELSEALGWDPQSAEAKSRPRRLRQPRLGQDAKTLSSSAAIVAVSPDQPNGASWSVPEPSKMARDKLVRPRKRG